MTKDNNEEMPTVTQVAQGAIVSNHVGKNGKSIDRLYGGSGAIPIRLVQADYTTYKGNITKVGILVDNKIDKTRMRSYCYKTDDNRWFDRGGMPIDKPSQLMKDNEEKDTDKEDIQEVL